MIMKSSELNQKKVAINENESYLCDRYEQQVSYILQILGEVDEDFKYCRVWDDTTFRDLQVSPAQLTSLSRLLGVQIMRSSRVVDYARFIFENRLDIEKRI